MTHAFDAAPAHGTPQLPACTVAIAALLAAALGSTAPAAAAEDAVNQAINNAAAGANPQSPPAPQGSEAAPATLHGALLQVPVATFVPGAVTVKPQVRVPNLTDAAAIQRGMQDFNAFNCVGCHMSNGGGGMGPALSNSSFIYGGEPENIYLTIVQGRPKGMPAWGAVLPDEVVWDLVAYIKSISNAPSPSWGTTVSATSPEIEQVPAEVQSTPKPWEHTQKFSKGQKP